MQVTNDIPCSYVSDPENNENGEALYVDPITRIIKKDTKSYPADIPGTPVMWKINGHWLVNLFIILEMV